MSYTVSQESTKSTIRSVSKEHAEAKLTREGKAGFVIGPIEAGGGGGSETGTGRATEQEQTFQVALALPSLRIVLETGRGSRELESDESAEFVNDLDEREDLAADHAEADEEWSGTPEGSDVEELDPELDEYEPAATEAALFELEEEEDEDAGEDLVESETPKRGAKARNLHNVETNDVFLPAERRPSQITSLSENVDDRDLTLTTA